MGIETSKRVFVANKSAETTMYQINNPDGSTIGITYGHYGYSPLTQYEIRWTNFLQDPGEYFQSTLDVLNKISSESEDFTNAFYLPKDTDNSTSPIRSARIYDLTPRFKLDPDKISFAYLQRMDTFFYYNFDIKPDKQKNLVIQTPIHAPEILTELVIKTSRNKIDEETLYKVLDYVGLGQQD